MMNMNPTQCNELSAEHDERTKWHNDDLRDAQRLDEARAGCVSRAKRRQRMRISGICDSAGLPAGKRFSENCSRESTTCPPCWWWGHAVR